MKLIFLDSPFWFCISFLIGDDDDYFNFVGNKADCKFAERSIRKEDGEKLAAEFNVTFMETSAKTGVNVNLAFTAIARYALADPTQRSVKSYKNFERVIQFCFLPYRELLSKSNDAGNKNSFKVQDYIKEQTQKSSSSCASCSTWKI